MNGRVYDPRTGRFLQADPTIQSPGNLQSFNRYTYVMNNPFFYTDPGGFSYLGDRWHALTGTDWSKSRDQYVKPIVAAVIAYYTGLYVGAEYGAAAGAIAGGAAGSASAAAMNGGNLGDVIRAAEIGAFSGAMFYGAGEVGDEYGNYGLAHYAAHAVAGCAQGEMMGGGCRGGAMSGAAGLAGTPYGFVGAIVAGGTVSVLGGGKFGNGAVTGAFGYLFNQCLHGKCTTNFEQILYDWMPAYKAGTCISNGGCSAGEWAGAVGDAALGIVGGVEVKGAKLAAQLEVQLSKDGAPSIYKSLQSFEDRLANHVEKLDSLQYKSSVEREIRTFQTSIDTIKQFIKDKGI